MINYIVSTDAEFSHCVVASTAKSAETAALEYAKNDELYEDCYFSGKKLYVAQIVSVAEYTITRRDTPVFSVNCAEDQPNDN